MFTHKMQLVYISVHFGRIIDHQACWPQKRYLMKVLPWQQRLVQPCLFSRKRMVPMGHWIMFLPNNYWGLVIKRENIRYEYQCDLSLEWWQICYVWYVSKVHQTGGDLIISNVILYSCWVFLNLLYIFAMSLWSLNLHVLSYTMHLIIKVPILN